jgi:PAS domain S-box-containing protein
VWHVDCTVSYLYLYNDIASDLSHYYTCGEMSPFVIPLHVFYKVERTEVGSGKRISVSWKVTAMWFLNDCKKRMPPEMQPSDEVIGLGNEKAWLKEELFNLRHTYSSMVGIGLPILAGLAGFNIVAGRPVTAVLVICMGLAVFWGFLQTRKGLSQEKEYRIYRTVTRCFLLVFLTYFAFEIGVEGRISRIQWSYIFPIAVFIFLGRKEGICWTAFFLVTMFFLVIRTGGEMAMADFKLRYGMSIMAMCTIGLAGKFGLEIANARAVSQQKKLRESEKRYRQAYEKLKKEMEERRQVQQALAESEEKYRLIFENSFDVIYSLDRELRFTGISPSVENALGYRPEELVGRSIQDLGILAEESLEPAYKDIQTVLGGGSIAMSSYIVIAKDGSRRFAEFSGAPLVRDGEVIGLISVGRDVSVQKKAEEELRKSHSELERRVSERTAELEQAVTALKAANRAKSDFLANMSHEFRTPLNHIMGFTELVVDKRYGDLNPTQQEYLGDVLHSSRHLLSLVNDVLDLSKVEAGKMELELSEVNLRMLLDSSMVMVREKAMKHGILLDVEDGSTPDMIRIDERKLKQVMYNLLSNAVKFTPDGGAITVAARPLFAIDGQWHTNDGEILDLRGHGYRLAARGRFIEISVLDTGIGIPGDDIERIFDPFEQGDNSIGRKYQGTGLGLSLTRRLVELHGGEIRAESEGHGKGSAFRFILPLDRQNRLDE